MNNLFINFISEKLIHINTSSAGKEFANVSFPCQESKTGYASFSVSMGQILNATKRDGSIVDGFKSILLGKADGTRKVSIATNKKGSNYTNIELTNAAIADMFNTARATYRAQRAKAQ